MTKTDQWLQRGQEGKKKGIRLKDELDKTFGGNKNHDCGNHLMSIYTHIKTRQN